MTLQLATYWEGNIDENTRNRIIILSSQKDQQKILEVLADPENVNNPNAIKGKNFVLDLLELDSTAKDSTIRLEASNYQVAIIRALNTLETVATIKTNIKSQLADKILDETYKGTVQVRYN